MVLLVKSLLSEGNPVRRVVGRVVRGQWSVAGLAAVLVMAGVAFGERVPASSPTRGSGTAARAAATRPAAARGGAATRPVTAHGNTPAAGATAARSATTR